MDSDISPALSPVKPTIRPVEIVWKGEIDDECDIPDEWRRSFRDLLTDYEDESIIFPGVKLTAILPERSVIKVHSRCLDGEWAYLKFRIYEVMYDTDYPETIFLRVAVSEVNGDLFSGMEDIKKFIDHITEPISGSNIY